MVIAGYASYLIFLVVRFKLTRVLLGGPLPRWHCTDSREPTTLIFLRDSLRFIGGRIHHSDTRLNTLLRHSKLSHNSRRFDRVNEPALRHNLPRHCAGISQHDHKPFPGVRHPHPHLGRYPLCKIFVLLINCAACFPMPTGFGNRASSFGTTCRRSPLPQPVLEVLSARARS